MHTETSASCCLTAGKQPEDACYDVDIIILALDRYQDTMTAIASARQQVGITFHISVLDQGSNPQTRRLFAEAINYFENVGFFTNPENTGVAAGRNTLSSLGHGRIIVALDSDAIFEDRFSVARAVAVFDASPHLGALGFKILCSDGKNPDLTSWGYPKSLIPCFKQSFQSVTFVGAGHAIRREAWLQAEGYDPNLFFTWEEFDFCLRLIARNWLVRYDGSIGVIHKASAEARVNWADRRTYFFVRNRLAIGWKWEKSWIRLLPRILAYLIRGMLSGQTKPTVQGIVAAFRVRSGQEAKVMPPAMRTYLRHHDGIHRGSVFKRVWVEVLGR
jgi:GT2 family glycosyltransferase